MGNYKFQARLRAKYFPIFAKNLENSLVILNPCILSFIDM
jgi:hypothetical protein